MTISALWDRFFWGFVLLVFAAIVWLWFFGESQRYFPWGLLVGLAIGTTYFAIGVRNMRAESHRVERALADAEAAGALARLEEELPDA
jgi:RsiW-degrading membrane proteinase PrsW (M82 family)